MSDNVQLSDIFSGDLMIKLTRSDSTRNMHRFYALQLATTLFGECVLIAEWGGIGFPGRVQERVHPSPAQAALDKRQTAKTRRGYSVTST
jgi:predicted DNA-binding WGR domain protein